ncbi:MAG: hypothetical protein GXP25_05145 [Planctomycetes bacterium]|nr:hypothetical protein [Planctomycetota bacterium]
MTWPRKCVSASWAVAAMDGILRDKPTLTDAFDGANSAIACIMAAESIQTGEKRTVPVYRR